MSIALVLYEIYLKIFLLVYGISRNPGDNFYD